MEDSRRRRWVALAALVLAAASIVANLGAMRRDYWSARLARLGERRAAEALLECGDPGALRLVRVLGTARLPTARASAAEALAGARGTQEVIAALEQARADADESVRRSVAGALSALGALDSLEGDSAEERPQGGADESAAEAEPGP